MNILIFAIGSRGDVQPYVALAKAAVEAGHDVTLSAPKNFGGLIESSGATYAELPTDFQALLQEPEMQAAFNSLKGRLKAFRWATDIMNAQLSAIWKIGLEVAPDLILNHFKAPLAPYLARRMGIKSIPIPLQPGFVATGEYQQFLMAKRSLGTFGNRASHHLFNGLTRMGTSVMIRKWRKATGTDIGPKLDVMAGHNAPVDHIHAFSPALIPTPKDWSAREFHPGYFFTDPEDFTPPDDLAAFLDAGETPIYVGFGSMPGIDHERTTTALIGALEKTGQRAVIATGWGGIADIAGDNVHVLDALPHTWLFPRVKAVVHHGGSGTTHEGLRWGKPSVVCPLFADQPFFGARVAAHGAGPDPIAQKKLTSDNLAAAIEVALRDETAKNAEALGEKIRAENAKQATLDLIETL